MSYTRPHVYEVRPRDGVHTLAVEGEVDPGVVIGLQRQINAALAVGYRRIVIDLGAVTGLGAQTSLMLGGALRRLSSRSATVGIVACPPPAQHVLERFAIDGIAFYPALEVAMTGLLPHPAERPEVFA
jgi:anti-anti-sigma regulatory factor